MQTTYTLNTDELDERFLASIKAAFPQRQVKIEVTTGKTKRNICCPIRLERNACCAPLTTSTTAATSLL